MYPISIENAIFIENGCDLLDPRRSCGDFEVSYDRWTETTTSTLHRDAVLGSNIDVRNNLVLNLNGHTIKREGRNHDTAICLFGNHIKITINGEEEHSAISAPGYAVRSMGDCNALEINGGWYGSKFRAIEWYGAGRLDIAGLPMASTGGPVTIRDADIYGDLLGINIGWLAGTVARISKCWIRGGVSFSADDSSLTVRDTLFEASEPPCCRKGLTAWGERNVVEVAGCTLHDGYVISSNAIGGSLTVTDTWRYDNEGRLVERGS